MKKIIIILVIVTRITSANSQTFLTEDFSSGTMPPTEWSIENLAAKWENSMSNKAGCSAPEAKFSYIDLVSFSRLVSPQIDLVGYNSIILEFNHYLDDWHGQDYSIGIATRSSGEDWNIVWQLEPTGNIGPKRQSIIIDNSNAGTASFQFCFFIEGDLMEMDYWHIDNIELYSPYQLDAKMKLITTNPFVLDQTTIEGVVKNHGKQTINSLELNWEAVNGEVYTSTHTGLNIEKGGLYGFNCPDVFSYPIGDYAVDVWISEVNGAPDDNPENDLITKDISMVSNIVYKRPMFEQFASSFSYQSWWINDYFVPWCDDHADSITLIKYPWRYPLPTDPYYTEECKHREVYYELTNYQECWLRGNGEDVYAALYSIEEFFAETILEPGFASMVATRSAVSSSNRIMDIDVNILPYANFNNFRLFVVVFETTTTGNVGDNGETEFKHILMKMVPDAFGSALNIADREPVTISQSIDLAGTNVEEWDDLGVAVFIQNYDTKEIFQSCYAAIQGIYASDATLSQINVNGNPIAGFNPGTFEYNVELPYGTTEIPEITGIPTDPDAIVIVQPAQELPGTVRIDVFAEDLVTQLTYYVNLNVITGIENNVARDIVVYPNPTTGIINIEGAVNPEIAVYSITGKPIYVEDNFNGRSIDLSSQPNGVYFIRIIDGGEVVTRRVVLSR